MLAKIKHVESKVFKELNKSMHKFEFTVPYAYKGDGDIAAVKHPFSKTA